MKLIVNKQRLVSHVGNHVGNQCLLFDRSTFPPRVFHPITFVALFYFVDHLNLFVGLFPLSVLLCSPPTIPPIPIRANSCDSPTDSDYRFSFLLVDSVLGVKTNPELPEYQISSLSKLLTDIGSVVVLKLWIFRLCIDFDLNMCVDF